MSTSIIIIHIIIVCIIGLLLVTILRLNLENEEEALLPTAGRIKHLTHLMQILT